MARDGAGVAMEVIRGLSTHIIKELLVNRAPCAYGKHDTSENGAGNGAAVPMES